MLPLKDSYSPSRFPFWVVVIILINIFMFYMELTAPNADSFIRKYALVPAVIDPSNWITFLPLITSQFLHGGFIHIISNMLFLWVFGDNIEERFGPILFPLFYLFAGAIGGLTQLLLNPTSTVPMIGASGAIAGVLGAYFALFPNNKVKTLVPIFFFITIIDIPASIMLVYWFITQIFSGTTSLALTNQDLGGVAYFAHVGGFISGWLVAKIFAKSSTYVYEGELIHP
jgi:membrane associated rhomboid family serine protease